MRWLRAMPPPRAKPQSAFVHDWVSDPVTTTSPSSAPSRRAAEERSATTRRGTGLVAGLGRLAPEMPHHGVEGRLCGEGGTGVVEVGDPPTSGGRRAFGLYVDGAGHHGGG